MSFHSGGDGGDGARRGWASAANAIRYDELPEITAFDVCNWHIPLLEVSFEAEHVEKNTGIRGFVHAGTVGVGISGSDEPLLLDVFRPQVQYWRLPLVHSGPWAYTQELTLRQEQLDAPGVITVLRRTAVNALVVLNREVERRKELPFGMYMDQLTRRWALPAWSLHPGESLLIGPGGECSFDFPLEDQASKEPYARVWVDESSHTPVVTGLRPGAFLMLRRT